MGASDQVRRSVEAQRLELERRMDAGHVRSWPPWKRFMFAVVGCSFLFFIASFVAAYLDPGQAARYSGPYMRASRDSHGEALAIRAVDSVRGRLKDGGSARFREVRFHADGRVTCGEVNAKNGFGGYMGYQRFIAGSGQVFLEEEVPDFPAAWRRMCR